MHYLIPLSIRVTTLSFYCDIASVTQKEYCEPGYLQHLPKPYLCLHVYMYTQNARGGFGSSASHFSDHLMYISSVNITSSIACKCQNITERAGAFE